MSQDKNMKVWKVPYKDKIIEVEASKNATKEEIWELADIQRENVLLKNQQKRENYEKSKGPVQKTIGETPFAILETAATIATSPLAAITNAFKEGWKEKNPNKDFPKWIDWVDGYNPNSTKSQEWLLKFAESEVAKLMEGVPPTMGGGIPRAIKSQAVKKRKLRTADGVLFGKSERPTSAQIRLDARNAYNRADEVGATIKQSNFKNFADRLEETLGKMGFDSEITSQNSISVVLKRMRELGKARRPIRLDELEKYRRMALNASMEIDPTTSNLGSQLIGEIDDFADSLNSKSLVSGSDEAVAALKDARMNWKRKVKVNELEWLQERSELTQGSTSTNKSTMEVMRREVSALLKNQKRRRGWTAEEIKSLKDFAAGGKVDKTLQRLSGFAPQTAFGGLSLGVPATIGGFFGGPTGAAMAVGGAYGTGLLSKKGLDVRSTNKMNNLLMDVATGGQPDQYTPGVNLKSFDTSAAIPLAPKGLLNLYDPNYEEEGFGVPKANNFAIPR